MGVRVFLTFSSNTSRDLAARRPAPSGSHAHRDQTRSRRGPLDTFALAPVRRQFRALAKTIVPESRELDGEQWRRVEAIIARALDVRPDSMVRQLRIFVRMISVISFLRFGRGFGGLDRDRRRRVMHGLENSKILLLRRGFWGVRTLVFMGYYGLPEVRDSIGYAAHPDGWSARD